MPLKTPLNKKLVHTLFEHQAAINPQRCAIKSLSQSVSYAELDNLAEQLANHLLAFGAGETCIVGVALDPGIDQVASLLAIFKAGQIYLPLDCGFPDNRLSRIFAKTPPRLLLASPGNVERLQSLWQAGVAQPERILVVEDSKLEAVLPPEPKANLVAAASQTVSLDANAGNYLFYTSGSTGEPKAILGQHKSLGHFIHWETSEFALNANERIAQLTQITFDASLRDIFCALTTGATLVIPDAETRHDMGRLVQWLDAEQISLIHTVPSLFRAMSRELPEGAGLTNLKRVILAGEMLYARDLQAWHKVNQSAEIINFYGATESTMIKMFHRIEAIPANPAEPIPAGLPISKTVAFVCKGDQLASRGEIGDIYIKTPFLSRGYYQDPERTAEIFVQNPLNKDQPDIVFKTGDRGRFMAGGVLEILGRNDGLVKINGARVEIAEVQMAVLRNPSVREAVVVTRQDLNRNNLLVCYFVAKGDLQADALRAFCLQHLPALMVPAFFVKLDTLPLNANGKVDRAALPNPEDLLYAHRAFVAPRNETERQLEAIWADVLRRSKVGVTHSFFEIGGHSLTATMVISRIFKSFGIGLRLHEFFDNPTIETQARLLDQHQGEDNHSIVPAPAQESYPLSHAQHRLWVLQQIDADGAAYNMPGVYVMAGALNNRALEKAFRALIKRHESLRTRLIDWDDAVRQEVLETLNFALQTHDLSQSSDPEAEAEAFALKDAFEAFDLNEAPLFRANLVRLSDTRHILVMNVHHIICDGWSMQVMLRDLSQLYDLEVGASQTPLKPLPIHYKDYAHWQAAYLQETRWHEDRDYWLQQLAAPTPLDLVFDRSRPKVQRFKGSTAYFNLDKSLCEPLKRYCAQQERSLFMGLYGVVAALLHRYTDQDDILIGSAVAGRNHPDLEDQIGCYINLLPLRSRMALDQSFETLASHCASVVKDAFKHESYPFDLMVDGLDLERDLSRAPLFDVMLVLHNTDENTAMPAGLKVSEFRRRDGVSRYDLTFHFRETEIGMSVALEYSEALFASKTIERLFDGLKAVLGAVMQDPQQTIANLNLLDPASHKQILENAHHPQAATDKGLMQRFFAQAEQQASATAITCADRDWSYAQLADHIVVLANHLQDQGLRVGDRVAILMGRSEWLPTSMLAVLAAGGVYVPIDPTYPDARIGHMLSDSGCDLILIDELFRDAPKLKDYRVIEPKTLANTHRGAGDRTRLPTLPMEALAYIIYTSGSTGLPKGVMISHGNLESLCDAYGQGFGFEVGMSILGLTTVSFDIAFSELIYSLVSGMRLVLIEDEDLLDGPRITELIQTKSVAAIQTTPSRLSLLLESDGDAILNSLQVLFIGGEAFPESLQQQLLPHLDRLAVFNVYGPTETTVWSSSTRLSAAAITIGKAHAGEELLILSSAGQLQPVGCPGEIMIGGSGVGLGYYQRPALTAERFVPHPFKEGQRLYKSGDRGLLTEKGDLLCLGRMDFQVKLRGVRLEPGEIEWELAQMNGVEKAVVVVRDVQGAAALCAYLVGHADLDLDQIRQDLGQKLPRVMVPSFMSVMAQLPMTLNGKIDRRALPDPEPNLRSQTRVAPRDELEASLAQIWAEVLGVPDVGVFDHFFESGGDSVKVIRLFRRLDQTKPGALKISDLFTLVTIDQIAAHLRHQDRDQASETPSIMEIEI